MKHITIEDIITSNLSEEELEHINKCEKCQELYKLFSLEVDNRSIEIIDQRVRESLIIKFREMKTLGKFNRELYQPTKINIIKYALVSVFSILAIVLVSILVSILTLGNIKSIEKSLEGNIVKLIGEEKITKTTLNYDNRTLVISLPDIKNATIIISPSKDVEKISLRIGTNEHLFLAKETKIHIIEGKPIFDNEIKPIKRSMNTIYLKNGEIFEGKLIEIKGDIIIFETTSGVREFKKSDVEKIKYSD